MLNNNYNKIFAQTNNFWSQGLKYGFSFDNNGKLVYLYNLKKDLSIGQLKSSICDFNGKPILYSDGSYFYNFKGEIIDNGNIKYDAPFWDSDIFMMTDTSNYISISRKDTNGIYMIPKVRYIIRDNKFATGFSMHPSLQEYYPFSFDSVTCVGACRNKKSQLVFVFRTRKYFYSALLKDGGSFQMLDSLYYPFSKIIHDSLKQSKFIYNNNFIGSEISIANNGEYISFTNVYSNYLKRPYNLQYYFNSEVNIMAFNKETGAFGTPKLIKANFWHLLINKTEPFFFSSRQCFSPNDSFLYYTEIGYNSITNRPVVENLYQYDVYNNITKLVLSNSYSPGAFDQHSNLALNHLGELFFFTGTKPFPYSYSEFQLNKITKPNLSFPACNLKLAVETIPLNFKITNFNIKHLYDYLRTSHNITYSCVATVNIKNNSQHFIGFTNYTWHIQDENGKEKYYYTKEPPPLTYSKNGNYVVKLFGYSPRGKGYGEWYIDTIKVRIPPKPIANFYAKDSIVCRYTGLQFYNHSYAKDTLKNEYLWSFGDGTTSSAINPIHTYTQPGVYTVTLHYKNGFCDSTLTKNQYIKVVDAPKPGFKVQYKQGCAPFVANFTDTTTLNVLQKDYYFSDTKSWQNIPIIQAKFNHTFTKAGIYKVLQKLTGYSGCIIMQDSVVFNISKGLTLNNTLHTINGTILNPSTPLGNAATINLPLLWWSKQDGAVKYQVYKNGSILTTTIDTFIQESKAYLADANYSVVGIDSCGNTCSAGRISKPIFLQGSMIGSNEASLLQYSPYLQWKGNNISYQLQKYNNNSWQTVLTSNSNTNYTDNQFLSANEVQACYRVQAIDNNNPNIVTHSNEICIPYIPTIYVPNAFSPNDDGINDIFDVTGFGIQQYNITIYNRWGEQVFKGNNNQPWNGNNASEGVYIAHIEFITNKGTKLNRNVSVNLIK